LASGKTIERKREGFATVPPSYLALIRRFPLRPLTSEADLDRATAVMNSLVDRDDLDPAEEDYLDVLGDLVERYEDKHHPIGGVSEEEMLCYLIEQKGVTQAEAARGARMAEATISEVLAGKRRLTREQMEKLAAYFHVGPAVFWPAAGDGKENRASRRR
jgi:HTH-type transcriptional regulator/antitoxin HigA